MHPGIMPYPQRAQMNAVETPVNLRASAKSAEENAVTFVRRITPGFKSFFGPAQDVINHRCRHQ